VGPDKGDWFHGNRKTIVVILKGLGGKK